MAVFDLPGWTALAPALILAATAMALFIFDSVSPHSSSRSLLAGTAAGGSLASMVVAVWFITAGVGTKEARLSCRADVRSHVEHLGR